VAAYAYGCPLSTSACRERLGSLSHSLPRRVGVGSPLCRALRILTTARCGRVLKTAAAFVYHAEVRL
jgi:hypothetical protein